MSNNSLEIVHEGWLIKSPPTKPIWRARWRRRWFVLRHSGELPGQYFLEYYTDRYCRKLKGKIDLDQCEQVDAGLKFEDRKQKYQYLFDVRTPKRTFYLAAESEKDMNKWVDCVCHVCGLKAYSHEDEYYDFMPPAEEIQGDGPILSNHRELSVVPAESPSPPKNQGSNAPVSLSGPYIPISECISGRPLNGNGLVQLKLNGDMLCSDGTLIMHHNNIPQWSSNKERTTPHTLPRPCSSSLSSKSSSHIPLDLPGEFYDMPRRLHPPNLEGIDQQSAVGTPPLHSPATTAGGTDGESINFIEEEDWAGNSHIVNSMTAIHGPPNVNWNTYPRDGEGQPVIEVKERAMIEDHATLKFARRYAKLSIADDSSDKVPRAVAPPRPPKPLHLMEATAKHSYLNLDSISPKYGPENVESVRSSDGEPSPGVILKPNHVNPHSPNQLSTIAISDETYDFPRSHQHGDSSQEPRHCYSNAAPGKMNDVFRYDFFNEYSKELDVGVVVTEEPTSPRSESSSLASSTVIYSNLPSPLCGPGQVPSESVEGNHGTSGAPPVVNRDLKPGRKASDSASHDLSPGIYPVPPVVPPTVDRTLKPNKKVQDAPILDPGPIKLGSPPACRTSSDNRSWRKPRAAPSPTPPPPASAPSTLRGMRCQSANSVSDEDTFVSTLGYAESEAVYFMRNKKNQFFPAMPHKSFETIQYLDLDHPESTGLQQQVPKSPERSQASGIVYKTVDFVKTEAFKRTKQEVEEERKNCTAAAHDL